MARASRSDEPLVVAFVDVDHLKAINDLFGHAAGDRMLVEVAQALREKLRADAALYHARQTQRQQPMRDLPPGETDGG